MKKVILLMLMLGLSCQAMAESAAGGLVYGFYMSTDRTTGTVGATVFNITTGKGVQCGYNAFDLRDTPQQAIVRAAMFSAIVSKLSIVEATGKPMYMVCSQNFGEITAINSSGQ